MYRCIIAQIGEEMIIPELKELIEKEGNEKKFQYRGFNCQILRNGLPYAGHLCGYIQIPDTSVIYGLEYDEVEEYFDYKLPAHGGLTFSGNDNNYKYCIGFDCAHSGDLLPIYREETGPMRLSENDTYKSMEYVENNIKEIIDFILKSEVKK